MKKSIVYIIILVIAKNKLWQRQPKPIYIFPLQPVTSFFERYYVFFWKVLCLFEKDVTSFQADRRYWCIWVWVDAAYFFPFHRLYLFCFTALFIGDTGWRGPAAFQSLYKYPPQVSGIRGVSTEHTDGDYRAYGRWARYPERIFPDFTPENVWYF